MDLSKSAIQTYFQPEGHVSAENSQEPPEALIMQSLQNNDSDAILKKRTQQESITGVILAGGKSTRMGRNKALLDLGGICLIEKTYQTMSTLFPEVILITNTPDEYAFLNCRSQKDIYPGIGSIAGLHAALSTSDTERIFVVPCDMPFLNPALINLLCQTTQTYDAVVPVSDKGMEPLHALYHRRSLQQLEWAITHDDKKLQNFLRNIWTYFLPVSAYRHIPNAQLAFQNINRPEDYAAIDLARQNELPPEGAKKTSQPSHFLGTL
ncbi:molybdenum cofactor guanylyltransferase [uncultured Desulfuromonas sp.]|uniref:molybdenum cofactor guanylyltransferase n=1 Tax=uncultured Desulfuromonas sp. TaxID=181013 RepID=UPI002AABDCF5|nr:molybdenum cofactor guanylyltransferase [uncultured Desulfuromonas sp.]